jgi:hypothetical protein
MGTDYIYGDREKFMDWSKLIDSVEKAFNMLSHYGYAVVAVLCVLFGLTFLPDTVLDWPAFKTARPIFLVLAIVCSAFMAVRWIEQKWKEYQLEQNKKRIWRSKIQGLTLEEKTILRRVLETGHREFRNDMFRHEQLSDMRGLDIVYTSSRYAGMALAFSVHSDVWELLKKEPSLLDES